MADLNSAYIPSLAQSLVPEVNKQIDEDKKMMKKHFDGLIKGEADRRKNNWKSNVDKFIENVKGIHESTKTIKEVAETVRNEREYLNPEASKEYEQWEHKISLLTKAGGNMKALGKAELENPNGDVDTGVKLIQGDRTRQSASKTLTNAAVDFIPYQDHAASRLAIVTPWSNGKEVLRDNATSSEEYDYIQGAIRFAYLRQFSGYNRNQLKKYLFSSMQKAELVEKKKWLKSRKEAVIAENEWYDNEKLRTDIDARGGIAVIDWINENKEYWGGTPKYQRTVAADKLSEMLKNDDISIQQAQQVLNQEFFAWDGSKQTVYNPNDPNKKPYWPEFEKLAAALEKKKADKSAEETRISKAKQQAFVLGANDQAVDRIKQGLPIDEDFRRKIQQDWVETFPMLPMPREIGSMLTTGEADDDEQIRGLFERYNRGDTPKHEDFFGIDDPQKLANALNQMGVARPGEGLDSKKLNRDITAWVNQKTQETDLTTAKTDTYNTIHDNATADFVSEYNAAIKNGQKPGQAYDEARTVVKRNIEQGEYRTYNKSEYNENAHLSTTKSLTALQTDASIWKREILPGFEKEAEAVYTALQDGEPLPTQPYSRLLYNRRGLKGFNHRQVAAVQANIWAKQNGLPTIPLPESRVDTALKNKPAGVTKALNNGDVHKALSILDQGDGPLEILEALTRSESVNNGGYDSVQTTDGWKDTNNILDKPLSKHSIEEASSLDLLGLGAYGMTKTEIEEALPFSGLTKDSELTEENQRALYAGLIYRNLYIANSYQTLSQFDSNPLFSDWSAMNISEGDALLILDKFGPEGPYNQKQFLLKALTN